VGENKDERFYISFWQNQGRRGEYTVGVEPPRPEGEKEVAEEDASAEKSPKSRPSEFEIVFAEFVATMETYRRYIYAMLATSPESSLENASRIVEKFAENNGVLRNDLSDDSIQVYELHLDEYSAFASAQNDAHSLIVGALHLPEVMVVGLMGVYDAFLAKLLRIVFKLHPKLMFNKDNKKMVQVIDVRQFDSIDSFYAYQLDEEIERVMRGSHHSQLACVTKEWKLWKDCETEFKLTGLWGRFVELCERRNLLTHTGGVVVKQYIENCKANEHDVEGVVAGQKLSVNLAYFKDAVRTVYEVGIKLCFQLWRKYDKEQKAKAEETLNELCFKLISRRGYAIAEALLLHGVKTLDEGNEKVRRMMIINLANAIRLQKRSDEANRLLDQYDWSACDQRFLLCVAAVKEDVKTVIQHMKSIGPRNDEMSIAAYRLWPVFVGMSEDPDFLAAFEGVFGEPLIKPKYENMAK